MMGALQPGDAVLFRRGDRFVGSLLISRSGAAGRPIRFAAYGSGDKPIIDGFHRLSGWQSIGGQRWKATYDAPRQKVPNLFINLRFQSIGRYPNIDEAHRGYLLVDGGDGHTQLGSASLRGGPWKDAEAVVRSRRWILDRQPITQHSGQRITLQHPTSYYTENGYGFFIVNHLNTLDQEGEWAYHPSTKELFLYTRRDPNTRAVIVAHNSELIALRNVHDILVQDLDLWGAALSAVFIRNCDNVTVNNCRFFGNGRNGVTVQYSKDVKLLNNNFLYTNNNGVTVEQGSSHTEIAYNTFQHTALVAGMGAGGNNAYTAIRGKTTYLNIHHNTIEGVGHNGISFVGDHINIQHNYISHFCKVKDDGAGVYAGVGPSDNNESIQIKNNIIGEGSPEHVAYGTPNLEVRHVNGVYLDQRNNHVTIEDNTLYRCAYFGLFLHNTRNCHIARNTLYDNNRALGLMHSDRGDDLMRMIDIQNNELFSRRATQELLQLYSAKDDHFQLGTIDNNYYYSPLKKERIIRVSDADFQSDLYSLAQWRAVSSYDLTTQTNSELWPEFEINRYLSDNLLPNAAFNTTIQGWQGWSSQGNGTIRHAQNVLDGGSMAMQFSGGSGDSHLSVTPTTGMGPVRENEHYVLRYHLKSNGNHEPLKAEIIARSGPYNLVSSVHYASSSTQRQAVEAFFTIDESISDARVRFALSENQQQMHLDNVELRKVEATPVNHDDYVQFLTNPSIKKTTLLLPVGDWKTLRGQTYQGSVELAPFRSLILVRQKPNSDRQDKSLAIRKTIEPDSSTVENTSHFQVYPNPLNEGNLTVTLDPVVGQSEIRVYDMAGSLLLHKLSSGKQAVTFSKARLGRGVRLVKVLSDDHTLVKKVIIE